MQTYDSDLMTESVFATINLMFLFKRRGVLLSMRKINTMNELYDKKNNKKQTHMNVAFLMLLYNII